MSKRKKETISVQGTEITVVNRVGGEFICITNIARHKNSQEPKDVVKNWMRNRETIEFLALWERIHNPNYKGIGWRNSHSPKCISKRTTYSFEPGCYYPTAFSIRKFAYS